MKRRILFLASVLFLFSPNYAIADGVFSTRCEGGAPDRPYFVTFDIDAKAVVLEPPPWNAGIYAGSPIAGDVISLGGRDKEDVSLMLHVPSGRIDPVFNRDRKTMTWPGIGDGTFRPTLVHKCINIPPRSILSFQMSEPILHPISIRCEDTSGIMFFTMDVDTKKVMFERGRMGRAFGGEVTNASNDEIAFLMAFEVPRRGVWSRSRQTITFEGIENDVSHPRKTMQCQEVEPRTMIVYREMILRR